MNLLLILLVFALFLLLTMVFGIWFMNFIVRKYIIEKHNCLDQIIHTGKVPNKWSNKFDSKMKKLRTKQADEEKILAIQQKANKQYVKKLKKLEEYVEKSRLIENERTRKTILSDLQNVYSQWDVKV
ncbi:hypothetical protein [Gracilibacillus alcaliphilus]|uniref:hypothetical protein n=1 Tax=Gracilibacillus alcaliphilus TaxID=1401441 RepID=UPI00195AFABC|nr:hypothetical protein [Gracilibacillus alcaliphilus]MBM7677859.1 hypothetical protein [Gracilibacillus alcaliphilus]